MSSLVLINPVAYLDSYALQGDMRALGLKFATAAKDFTTAASGGSELAKPGLKKIDVSLKGFSSYGTSPAQIIAALQSRVRTSDIPYMVSPAGAPVADPAFFLKTMIGSYDPLKGNIGDEVSTDVSLMLSSSDIALGQILLPEAARVASANSAVTQLGAVSATQKLYGVVHVIAKSGSSPTLDIAVKSATVVGFGSPTTRVTVPQFTNTGSYWIELTGPVTDQYWRVDCTIGGGSPSFTFIVALGIDT
jgi:hypothetical protein